MTLWRNDTEGNNYLAVKLNGEPPNTEAVGARITLRVGDRNLMREVTLGSNFASNNPTDQLFGLGQAERVETLTVAWPDGSETVLRDLEANQRLDIHHPRL
ncbi:MAG: ASPIC/UnbV domain-containing protein [Gammaproteobacteria bacterium]|nr:ASPIC/UnbV domain-containing protein [Gammaproteobacteria bacterium]